MNSVTNHDGTSCNPDDFFFAPAPGDIGKLHSQNSSVTHKTRHQSIGGNGLQKGLMAFTGFVGGVAVGALILLLCFAFGNTFGEVVNISFSAALGVLGALFVVYKSLPQQVSYIGDKGVARLFARRGQLCKQEMLRFEEAQDLVTARTEQYVNGLYTATVFDFRFRDRNRKKLFQIAGSYRKRKGAFKGVNKHVYHFALAAEEAWNRHRLPQLNEEVKKQGYARFSVPKGEDWVGVGPNRFILSRKNKRYEWKREDVKDWRLGRGKLIIKPKKGGKHVVSVNKMGDSTLFFWFMKHHLNLYWN